MSPSIIDAQQVTNFDRSDEELEAFWLFCVMVAGKNAKMIEAAVERFLAPIHVSGQWITRPMMWCAMLGVAGVLREALVQARTGKYTVIEAAIYGSLHVNLRTATVDELVTIHGVGPKTARYFVMHSRPDQRLAALDVHLLRWLRDQGYDAPATTPSSPATYAALEAAFLAECDARGKSPAQFDLEIWNSRSKNGTGVEAA